MINVEVKNRTENFELDVSFDFLTGITGIFGRSGAGKTTLINIIAGILRPHSGKIMFDEKVIFDSDKNVNLPKHLRRIGYVAQDSQLFPHYNVEKNLVYSKSHGTSQAANFKQVVDVLGIVNILDRRPNSLSGGEQQRVAIARAILSEPDLLIMDEPLSSLDLQRREKILPFIERLRDSINMPILYVSHDLSEITRLADNLILLDAGKIVKSGTVEEMMSNIEIMSFFGKRDIGSTMEMTVTDHSGDGLTKISTGAFDLWIPHSELAIGSQIRIRLMAHDILISKKRPHDISALNIIEASIAEVREGAGPGVIVALKVGASKFLARITLRSKENLGLAVGQKCYAIIKAVSVAPNNVSKV